MIEYILTWFNAEGDDTIVGSEVLNITVEELKTLFFVLLENEFYGCHIVRASQRKRLQELVQTQIDLNQYDYFVEDQQA